MKGSDRNLECAHGTHQLNDVMGLIPAGIEQRETSRPLPHKVVIDLVLMNVVLFTALVIRG